MQGLGRHGALDATGGSRARHPCGARTGPADRPPDRSAARAGSRGRQAAGCARACGALAQPWPCRPRPRSHGGRGELADRQGEKTQRRSVTRVATDEPGIERDAAAASAPQRPGKPGGLVREVPDERPALRIDADRTHDPTRHRDHETDQALRRTRAGSRTYAVGRGGEVFGFLGPERRRQDHDDPHAARPAAPDQRRRGSSASTAAATASRSARGSATCPGDFAYDPRLTGRELLAFFAALRGMTGSDARTRSPIASRPTSTSAQQLSRGNRQKVGLIQAIFHEPELLDPRRADERARPADAGGVPDGRRRGAERGLTVFLSSHELDEVGRVCDRVGIIREGRLIAVERVADLTGAASATSRSSSRTLSIPRSSARCPA